MFSLFSMPKLYKKIRSDMQESIQKSGFICKNNTCPAAHYPAIYGILKKQIQLFKGEGSGPA
jgi:hypothetical protein